MTQINGEDIFNFIVENNLSDATKIYLGVDSQAFKRRNRETGKSEWWADYYKVVVVHKNGRNGCKLFYEKDTERDFSANRKKPSYRLMQEAYKAADLYARLADVLTLFETEIHLDLNPNKKYASSHVISQAIGYIKASCGVDPLVKPDSWAATHAADRLVRTSA